MWLCHESIYQARPSVSRDRDYQFVTMCSANTAQVSNARPARAESARTHTGHRRWGSPAWLLPTTYSCGAALLSTRLPRCPLWGPLV